jgi:hypothetical protein
MNYIDRHLVSGFKVGDEVIVTRVTFKGEDGWDVFYDHRMDYFVGKKCRITADYLFCGFHLELVDKTHYPYCTKSFSFPYFVIELVNKKKEETPTETKSEWNSVCQRCGAPAYQGLFKVECSKGCKC